MEELLNKDRLTEVNPYLFNKIQAKIEQKQNNIPSWGKSALKYSLALVILLLGFNFYALFETHANNDKENIAYNKFVEDNYFDVLGDFYPSEIIKAE